MSENTTYKMDRAIEPRTKPVEGQLLCGKDNLWDEPSICESWIAPLVSLEFTVLINKLITN